MYYQHSLSAYIHFSQFSLALDGFTSSPINLIGEIDGIKGRNLIDAFVCLFFYMPASLCMLCPSFHLFEMLLAFLLDVIAFPSTYPCQSVGEWVIDSFRLEIAIASPSFASLLLLEP